LKTKLVLSAILLIILSSCSIVKQGKELKNLFLCDYSLKSVKLLDIAGVDTKLFENGSALSMDEYITLFDKVMSNDLPADFLLDFNVYNPTSEIASAQGMDWVLEMKENNLLNGTIDTPVIVPSKKSSDLKIKVSINIFKLINSGSLNDIINILQKNDWKDNWKKLGLKLKLKPWYLSGNKVLKYPGYITINIK
jgi:hypothetical protein